MDKVLDLLSKRKWQKHCLKTKIAQPEDIRITGSVKVAKIYSNVLKRRDKEPDLYDAIKEVAREWWGDETQITQTRTWSASDTGTTATRSTPTSCGSVTSQEEH